MPELSTHLHPSGQRVIWSCGFRVYGFSERTGSPFTSLYWRDHVHDAPPPEALCGCTKREHCFFAGDNRPFSHLSHFLFFLVVVFVGLVCLFLLCLNCIILCIV